jgi:formate hydrogenlyase transcriptional activator
LQLKILRVLQEDQFECLGSSRTLRINARLIAATNRYLGSDGLRASIPLGSALPVKLISHPCPALRERAKNIAFLVQYFAQHFARNMRKQIELMIPETMNALLRYSWPRNIREMQNVTDRASGDPVAWVYTSHSFRRFEVTERRSARGKCAADAGES